MNILILTILLLTAAFLSLALLGRIIEHPFEARKSFNFNEKWTVSLSKAENEKAIMDEFYLYTLNFIYGDLDLKKRTNSSHSFVSQKIGQAEGCKIRLSGEGVASQHGKISFHQDYGLIYEDLTYTFPRPTTIKSTCINAPYGKRNSVSERYIPITDGLKLFIADFVLTFKVSYTEIFKKNEEVYNNEKNKNDAPLYLRLLTKFSRKFLRLIPIVCYRAISKIHTFLKGLENKLSKMAE